MCEVTSENFFQILPSILEQIDRSCFLAIDTEFSSIDGYSSSIDTIEEFYRRRANFVKQMTIFQFGLAIFSQTSAQHRYDAKIYNFYLHPTSISPIDVRYSIQASSIKFLAEYQFDFNKCFYSGISFLNQTQEKILFDEIQSKGNGRFSINEQQFLNNLFEKINKWLITASIGDRMEYHFVDEKPILNDYQLQSEIRRCFQTIWTTIQFIDTKKILLIEHISKDTYEQRLKGSSANNEELQAFIRSIVGFTKLICYLKDHYRKPIVGHNCFLDWLLIYEKFLDILPTKFEEFRRLMNENCFFPIFDTKYLASEMKAHLFTRQHRSEMSNYIDNLTTATSLSSLYDLLTSKYYENLIFFKPTIDIHSNEHQIRKHEAASDAYMSGVIFLKLIYLFQQKRCNKIEWNDHQSTFEICLNHIQIYKNRFYSTFLPHISLNRYERNTTSKRKKFRQCLVLEKHNREKVDMSDVITRFNSYCSMEYEIHQNGKQIYLFFQSENCQGQILHDYLDHPFYQIEKFNCLKHSTISQYALGMSIVMSGICLFLLVKTRM